MLAKKTGARGLRSVIERVLMDSQFEITQLRDQGVTELRVSRDNVENFTPVKQVLTDEYAQI